MSALSSSGHKVLTPVISCHAWNKDKSKIALCPGSNEVWIYETKGSEDFAKWERTHVLTEHDHYVTDIDWAPESNKILTCSQDRNAHVWNYNEKSKQWEPTLVLLRITKAATCCKWSPREDKFAVGSAAKVVSICFYEEANKWYVSKLIKKPKSTVKSVSWHPKDNTLVAAGSTDMKGRVFSSYIKDVDGKSKRGKFGMSFEDYVSKGWVHDIQFSPSGNCMALIGHDSTVQFVAFDIDKVTSGEESADPSGDVQVIQHNSLPFYKGIFLSDNAFVAVGHDFEPFAFVKGGDSAWKCIGSCDKKEAKSGGAGGGSAGVKSAFLKFQRQASVGSDNASKDDAPKTRHHNAINCIKPFTIESNGNVTKFTTSGVDGKILFWDIKDIQNHLTELKL